MKHPRKQALSTAFVPLLVTLALVGAACGSPATPGSTSPGRIELTPESNGAVSTTGHEVGQQAPDFVMTLDDGREATLESLTAENRPVVLYFFTTW